MDDTDLTVVADAHAPTSETLRHAISRIIRIGREVHAAHAHVIPDPLAFKHRIDRLDRHVGDGSAFDAAPTAISDAAIDEMESVAQTLMHAARRCSPDDRHTIAESLSRLGAALDSVQRHAAALRAYEAAVDVFQIGDSQEAPDRRATLAAVLNNLGVSRMQMGLTDAAIRAFRDAIAIHTELASQGRDDVAARTNRARVWNNLCVALIAARRFRDAHAALRESAMLRAEIALADPQTGGLPLANSLATLAALLSAEGRRQAAMTVVAEVGAAMESDTGAHVHQMRAFLLGFFAANDRDDGERLDARRAADDQSVYRRGRPW
mgnify:CR=1 FL=1